MKADYEIDAINRFTAFLKATRGVEYAVAAEDVVVDQATGTNYDYRLETPSGAPPLAVEIFRLIESEEEIAERRHLGILWEAIKTEFTAAGLEDLFVHTPYESPVGPRRATEFAKALAAMAVRETTARPLAKQIRLEGGFEVERIEGLGAIVCGSHSDARWIDSVGIATPPLLKNLAKKDRQLATTGCERIALCANWAPSVDSEDAAEAVALLDTSGLINIDTVYFDTGRAHQLVYARKVRDALAGDVLVVLDPEEKGLLDKWLAARLGKEIPGAFEVARKMVDHVGTASVFADRHTREAIVRSANKRVQSGDHDAGLWTVAHFRDDVDPPLENYPDDPDGTFNYHEQVKRGEDPSAVVGVRAAVCWLIQRLICLAPERSWQLIDDVERLATGPNLYVRQNACVPLVEFATRRRWVDDAGQHRMPADARSRVKTLAFKMLRDNRQYPPVLDWVALVFGHMPDLEQAEAEEVLDVFLATDLDRGLQEVARLLGFFAAFRAGHPRFPAPFDSAPFAARLEDALLRGRDKLRHAIAYMIFKTIEDDASHAPSLRRYILMLPDAQLTGHAPHFFYDLVEPLIDAGVDPEVEAAILKMIATEAAWSVAGPGRFLTLTEIASVLRKLGDNGRWDVVVSAVETLAAAHPPLVGSTAELEPLVRAVASTHAARLARAIRDLANA
jgi:hypothetical protein